MTNRDRWLDWIKRSVKRANENGSQKHSEQRQWQDIEGKLSELQAVADTLTDSELAQQATAIAQSASLLRSSCYPTSKN